MTVLMRPETPVAPGGIPGRDIVCDLTPPELLEHRAVAVLRRKVLAALVLVLALCAGGYALATFVSRSAHDDSLAASRENARLTRQVDQYAGITRLEQTVSEIDREQASVMASDVDVAALLRRVRGALPRSMSISSLDLSLSSEDGVDPGDSGDSTSGLDASGHRPVGTVTISGTGRDLEDLPAFVDRLARIPGVADVLPTSNQVDRRTSQFNVALDLTDRLLTHDFDAGAGARR